MTFIDILHIVFGFGVLSMIYMINRSRAIDARYLLNLIKFQDTAINRLTVRCRQSENDTNTLKGLMSNHEEASGGFWKIKSGRLMRIKDMTNLHLVNSILFCEENPGRADLQNKLRELYRERAWRKLDIGFQKQRKAK